jgi:hypothetical protein
MNKDAYYFPHDSNARHDPKMSEMIADFGMEGYGIFWVIIEVLREQKGYKLELKRINAIAMQSHTGKEKIQQFIEKCINQYDLFKCDKDSFWSESLLKRMIIYDEKSEKARRSARIRWDKDDANAKQSHSECNASKVKYSKVNKSKVKESKEEYTVDFEQFWKLYERKGNKRKSFNCWKRLTKTDRIDIMSVVEMYVKSTPDLQYRKDAQTYLNPTNRHWEDEIRISEQSVKQKESSILVGVLNRAQKRDDNDKNRNN